MTQTLSQLENSGAFIERHIGPDAAQQQEMLNAVGAQSLNALTGQIVPKDIQLATPPQVGAPATEYAALAELKAIASRNKRFTSYIGMGYTAVQLPPVILRNMLENPGWYTAYTPYQPEVSQGRLEALLNFQQVTLDLTGLDMASASLLDEATAAAEAMAMAKRVSKLKNANRFFVASDVHPQTLDVVRTRAETFGFEVIVDDAQKVLDHQDVFGVLLQQVGTTGEIHDYTALISELKSRKIVVSVAADIMALVLLTAPGKQGADIVFGSAQRFGVPMGYGGPHAAFFAAKDEYKRSMPGRIIGVSKDAAGNTALRMAMQTREQHIRREKANSNICTSQVLLANIASLYAVYHGPVGLKRIANRIHRLTDILAAGLQQKGLKLRHAHYFDTLCVEVADKAGVLARAEAAEINLRSDILNAVGITLDETTTRENVMQLFSVLLGDNHGLDIDTLDKDVAHDSRSIQPAMLRDDEILTHPVFNRYHSETEMMRYMHSLERKDLALNQAMIPLGSCTMKLNAAADDHDFRLDGDVLRLFGDRLHLRRPLHGVQTRLGHSVQHSRHDGIRGLGRARNRVNVRGLLLDDETRNLRHSRIRNAGGVAILGHFDGGHCAVFIHGHSHLNGAFAADFAVADAREDARVRARNAAQGQQHRQRQQERKELLHGSPP